MKKIKWFTFFAISFLLSFSGLDISTTLFGQSLVSGGKPAEIGKAGNSWLGGIHAGEIRTMDGTGNNPLDLGAVGSPLLRISGTDYPDGLGEVMRSGANPRMVSNLVVSQGDVSIPSAAGMSDAVWAWGQFIDHDLDLTDSSPANGTSNIPVLDPADILFPTIFFNRANHVIIDGVREPFNELTSFLDASNVYGSSDSRAAALRTFSRGRLKTSKHNLLPFNVDGLPNLGEGPDFFLAGDIRSNENVVLTSMHTLFVREHNRLATMLRVMMPRASDEEIYQMARKIVGAEIQKITYQEFLPTLLGPYAPSGTQAAWDPGVDPSIANEFSAALFRVGHTLLSSNLIVGQPENTILLRDAFSNPDFIINKPSNIGLLLRGLSVQPCQEIDATIVDDVRTFLFLPPPFAVGLDLAALNMQRARDHGMPVYNIVRMGYGLPPVSSFADITANTAVQDDLAMAYGSVDEIDPWVGGICEDHLPGANVGPLIAAAIIDQFTRLRDGDRFFYTADPSLQHPMIRGYLNTVTFGRLIRWNTGQRAPIDMFHAE